MKITGYQLREAIRAWELKKSAAEQLVPISLTYFKGEPVPDPKSLIEQIADAEQKIAQLETVQTAYNLSVMVTVLEKKMTLTEAIKAVGGAGRVEKLWRMAVKGDNQRDRGYGYQENRKEKDTEIAQRAITVEAAMKSAHEAAKYAGAVRASIAQGNNEERDIKELDRGMLP